MLLTKSYFLTLWIHPSPKGKNIQCSFIVLTKMSFLKWYYIGTSSKICLPVCVCMCLCVKEKRISIEKVKFCCSLWFCLSIKALAPCSFRSFSSCLKWLVSCFLLVCGSEQNGKLRGRGFAFSLSRMPSRAALALHVANAACSLQTGWEPGWRKLASDKYILPLSLLGTDLAQSQWVIPSVPWSQDYFLPHLYNDVFLNTTF